MFDKYLDMYMLKMASISIIKETIENNIPKTIEKEISQYQEAILMDVYFDQLLVGKIDNKLEEHVKKCISVNEINKDDKKISYKYNRKGDALNKFKNIDESRKMVSLGIYTVTTMYNNILISILIEFEIIIAKIFKEIITRYPEAYLKDTTFTYAQIIKSKDIDEVKRKIISEEVEQIMRENIFKWIKNIENKHKVKIPLENQYAKDFIEAYLRRNIVVHNDSKINSDYISGMKSIGKDVHENMIGKKLICSKEYIKKVIDSSIYMLIFILNQIMPLFKEENENFTNAIINFGFQKIKDEEYTLAREIFRLLINNKALDQQSKVYSLINYWQTFKWEGKYDEIKNEIEKFDISAYEELIKLAIYALREEYDKIENILNNEFNTKKQNEELAVELEDFPVFKEVRKQKFYKYIREQYIDAFSIKSTQIDEENEEERKEIVKKDKDKFNVTISMIMDSDNDKEKQEKNKKE